MIHSLTLNVVWTLSASLLLTTTSPILWLGRSQIAEYERKFNGGLVSFIHCEDPLSYSKQLYEIELERKCKGRQLAALNDKLKELEAATQRG
jgi:hypothetical protein